MNTLLLFPPHTGSLWPYLGCPALTAYLKSQGIQNVKQRDLNVQYYREFLSPDYVLRCAKRAEIRLTQFGKQKTLKDLQTADEYSRLVKVVGQTEYVTKNIKEAVRILKDPREQLFSDHEFRGYREIETVSSKWAKEVIFGGAFEIISAAHYPTQVTYNFLKMRYSCFNVGDIHEASVNAEENPYIDWFKSDLMPWLKSENPGLVGMSISLYTQLIPAFTLSRLIKEWKPDTYIVFGGEICTKFSANLLDESCKDVFRHVDAFVKGEGERPLQSIIEALEGNGDLSNVPSVVRREGNKVFANWKEDRVSMNEVPAPSYDGIDFDAYLTPVKKVSMRVSKGCYWAKCTFCTYDDMVGPVAFNVRDAERVAQDMLDLQAKYDIRHVYFVDEALPPKTLFQISNYLIEQDAHITWEGLIRFEKTFTYENLAKMARAGCVKMVFGLESINQRVAKLMKKGNERPIVQRILRDCKRLGIVSHAGIIVGFPTEEAHEAQETYDFVADNIDYFFGPPMFWHFELETQSPVFQRQAEFNLKRVWPKDPRPGNLDYTWNYEPKTGLGMSESRKLHKTFLSDSFSLFMDRHQKSRSLIGESDIGAAQEHQSLYVPSYVSIKKLPFDYDTCLKILSSDYEAHPEKYLIADSTEAPLSNPFRWHNAGVEILRSDKPYAQNCRTGQLRSLGAFAHAVIERCEHGISMDELRKTMINMVDGAPEKISEILDKLCLALLQEGFLLGESQNKDVSQQRKESIKTLPVLKSG